jgi:hypothetical protein
MQRGVCRIFDCHANLRLDIHILRRRGLVNGWVMILSAVTQNNSMWTAKKAWNRLKWQDEMDQSNDRPAERQPRSQMRARH